MRNKKSENIIIPQHVAFIMDGNRRWARERGLPTGTGHNKAVQRLEPLILYAKDLGIKHLTFWAFSTENWKRDKREITTLMRIFRIFFKSSSMKRLMQNNIQIRILGDIEPFPADVRESMQQVVEETKENDGQIVNMALNYGGRAEILRTVNLIIENENKAVIRLRRVQEPSGFKEANKVRTAPGSRIKSGMTTKESGMTNIVDEETFSSYMYTAGQPDPDLIVRTGGDQRLSGFLAWQSVYSELYFTKTYWPDFDSKELDKALEDFSNRQRRFGK